MSTVLVTGASGFIGKMLVSKLLAKGHQIYALSRHPPRDKNLVPVIGDILEARRRKDIRIVGVQKIDYGQWGII